VGGRERGARRLAAASDDFIWPTLIGKARNLTQMRRNLQTLVIFALPVYRARTRQTGYTTASRHRGIAESGGKYAIHMFTL
jgi:hypothetical protein